ncbi:MAG: nicotinamide riboside transporter PnuC [Scytonematopsis contorta HA4267-MV1]|nr:nicotinamide riboside transporter PnuC [Scytonematopsis contorta HA4267-MV1]
MSYVELIGTILNLWSVWLISKQKMLTWPVGIVGSILFLVLFYQIRLYADMLEQIYYVIVNIYGWWRWLTPLQDTGKILTTRYSSQQQIIFYVAVTIAGSFAMGALMSRIHLLFPALFAEAASFPYLDSFTTIMSFTAMWLMAQKKIESWYYWIVVNIIGIGLYYAKGVKFISLLYAVFLLMAINGLCSWIKMAKTNKP